MHFPLEHTFNTTPGLVLWTARKAHWATRCSAAPNNEPTFEQYVHKWPQELKTLLMWLPLKAHHASVQKLFNSLMHFIEQGTFKTVHINWRTRRLHDVQPLLHDNPKQQKRHERKATMAQQVMAIQQVYLTEGWHTFHFDGSAKHYSNAGWPGGFGSCHQGALGVLIPRGHARKANKQPSGVKSSHFCCPESHAKDRHFCGFFLCT